MKSVMQRVYFFILLSVIISCSIPALRGEGSRELRPDTLNSTADLFFDSSPYSGYPLFGIAGCLPEFRINIHVSQPGEKILFGMKFPWADIVYNLRRPDGTIAMTGTCPYLINQQGYIRYHKQAVKGPFPLNGGYTPLSYEVTNPADTGDYYFEIVNLPAYMDARVPIWDFQVVNGSHSPALPSDTVNGRVWSGSWQINSELGSYVVFNGRFFIYSDDGVVTKLSFTNARVGVFDVFCNPYGCLNTGNFLSDRRSKNNNTYASFPGIAQYRVFLNTPDPLVYPTGFLGSITAPPSMVPDPAFPPCSGNELINLTVNKPGRAQIRLIFPTGSPATDVNFFIPVDAGLNQVPWNGLDGQNNPVPDNTPVTVEIDYFNGLTNLPIWDLEQNPNGYRIALISPPNPANPNPLVYWDDTEIQAGSGCPTGLNLTGCLPAPVGCHTWSGADCHNKMINSWWYGNIDSAGFVAMHFTTPPEAVTVGDTLCGAGSAVLTSMVLQGETADWYDSLTGGTLLQAGTTVFTTPVLAATTTYFVQVRNPLSGCESVSRTPVTATVLPVPVPTVSGPAFLCLPAYGVIYSTEPGKTAYQWQVSSGGMITGGAGTASIAVDWLVPGQQWVSAGYTEPGGCPAAAPTVFRVVTGRVPAAAGPIQGPAEVCEGTTGVTYSVPPVAMATGYEWSLPAGVILVAGAGTDSIIVDFPPGAASGNITVTLSNPCGSSPPSDPLFVAVNPAATANAGPDGITCMNQPFTVTGATIQHAISIQWFTNGMGILSGDTTLSPIYLPATDEIGTITMTLVAASAPSCPPDTSTMHIHILSMAVVSAGDNLTSCAGSPVQITNAWTGNAISHQWSSSGDGTFSDPSAFNPHYFPGPGDTTAGQVILKITAIPPSPCPPVADSLLLDILKSPVARAGPSLNSCGNDPVTISEAFVAHASPLQWSTGGDGTFDDPAAIPATYTPGPLDLQNGKVSLFLTANPYPPCTAATDSLLVVIHPTATADAGPGLLTCALKPVTVTGATASGYSSILWTHSGNGVLDNPTSLTPTYHPDPGDPPVVTLRMVASGAGACIHDTVHADTRLETLSPPEPAAGQPQTIPYNTAAELRVLTSGGSGSYAYQWEPAGMIENPEDPEAFTLNLTSITLFFITVTDELTGCTGTDSVLITVQTRPDTTECLHVYNTITPNGDGLNDTWIIDCISQYPGNHVSIFNRYGDLVREFDDYNNKTVVWDGKDRHQTAVPDGTYYFTLTLKPEMTRTGWIYVRDGNR